MWYTSSYLAGVMWLSLRLSPLYPASLTPLDPALCSATIAVYLYGFASPVRTVLVIQHVDSAALVLPHPLPWCCHTHCPGAATALCPGLRRPTLPNLSPSPGPWLGPSPASLSLSLQAPGWAPPQPQPRPLAGLHPREAQLSRSAPSKRAQWEVGQWEVGQWEVGQCEVGQWEVGQWEEAAVPRCRGEARPKSPVLRPCLPPGSTDQELTTDY